MSSWWRVAVAVAFAATLGAGCSGSSPQKHGSSSPTTATTTTPAPTATGVSNADACSAARGRLVPSHAPFSMEHRLIQPFGYVNLGAPCYQSGFPVVRLYDGDHHALNIRQINGDVVLGTATSTRNLLQRNDDSSGFNIETPMINGPCETARYVSASFGGGSTPLAAIRYQLCGRMYVTVLFR